MMAMTMPVVMTMRVFVARMPMVVRMRYRRTSVKADRSNHHSANPREYNLEMTNSVVFQETQGEDQDATQSKSDLFLTP
jgi:hypothetical protein